jgi:hypothetical protein
MNATGSFQADPARMMEPHYTLNTQINGKPAYENWAQPGEQEFIKTM